MNSKLTNVFFSFLLPTMLLMGCSETPISQTKYTEEIIPQEKDEPFYFTLNSSKADSLNLAGNVRQTGQEIGGIRIFCEDDFTTLPNWTMHIGKTNLFANTDFNFVVMSFDEKNSLQRALFVEEVKTKEKQNEVYKKLKKYLDNNYTTSKSFPFFSENMKNVVIKNSANEDFYTGYVNQDIENYRVSKGYITLKKRLIGIADAPVSIRPSTNGIYAEYSNIGNDLPEWKDAPDGLEVTVDYFSNSFSNMYDKKCK